MSLVPIDDLHFLPAYVGKKCSLKPKEYAFPGVYFIKEEGVISYIGMSRSNAYKSLYRHFQEWNDYRNPYMPREVFPPYERTTYFPTRELLKYDVSIIKTGTPTHAGTLEKLYIREYQPRDNKEKYELFILEDLEGTIEEIISKSMVPFVEPEKIIIPF